ncbi:MAG: AsmA-like C-terminal region-containing protein [Bacteroidota bacterium]
MALSRKAKTWIIVLSIPLVLIVVAGVGLKLYFTNERLKSIVVPALEEGTGRDVSLHNISLSIFTGFALEMDSLVIANRSGEGFSSRPFLSLDRLVLNIRLMALLKSSLEVTTMLLEHPQLLIEVNEQGLTNYDFTTPADTAGSSEVKVSVERDASALFSNMQIVSGRVEYIDRQGNSATTLEGLNLKLQGEVLPVVGELRMHVESDVQDFSYGSIGSPLVSGLKLALTQDISYRPDRDVLVLTDGKAKVQEIGLDVAGSISDLKKTFMMDIKLESDKVNIADVLSLMPKEYMAKAEGVKGNGVARISIAITGTVNDSTEADIAGSILVGDASIQYPGLPKAITNVSIAADFERSKVKQEFVMKKFSALLGTNPVRAQMQVVDFDDPALTLAAFAELNLAEVKEYYPLETGTELSGALKAQVNIAGKVSNPEAMKSSGTMDFKNVTVKTAGSKNPVQNLNGTLSFNNQILESKKLSLMLGTSDLSLAFRVNNYLSLMMEPEKGKKLPKPTATISLTSNRIATADLMGEDQPASQSKPEAGEKKPGGLPLPNMEMDVNATIGTLAMEKMELKDVRSTMRIANGIITVKNFTCNTFGGAVTSRGTLDMQKPERPVFDLALDMKGLEANQLLGKFTSFGSRLFGKLNMSTTLKGALDDTLGLVPQALNGVGDVKIESGKVTGVKLNQELASMLKLPDMEIINFNDWVNSFSVADGKLLLKDLKISALGADYLVNGAYGLDGTLDYKLSLFLSEATSAKVSIPGVVGEAAKFLKDESGRVRLDFGVSGTTDNPKVALDTKRVEDIAKQKLDVEKKKLEDQLKKKGEDLLKGLFKKKE